MTASNYRVSYGYPQQSHYRLFVIISIVLNFHCISTQTYNGPESEDYFRLTLLNKPIAGIPQLQCDSYETSHTNATNEVNYYRINITSSLKERHGLLHLTTCCDLEEISTNDSHYPFCNSSSLDTVLYTLTIEHTIDQTKIDLIEVVDDIPTPNIDNCGLKSYIDLINYDEGEYIVAVGGYAHKYGKYRIGFDCIGAAENYAGWEVDEEWFQREYNLNFLNPTELETTFCGSKRDETTIDHAIQYYKFTLTAEMIATYTTKLYLTTCCVDIECESFYEDDGLFTLYDEDNIPYPNNSNYTNSSDLSWYYRYSYLQRLVDECTVDAMGEEQYDMYCSDSRNDNNLYDTVLFFLQEHNDKVSIIKTDDDQWEVCSEGLKSYIDISNQAEGEYIIGIGSFYRGKVGTFTLNFVCEQYSFPLKEYQFKPREIQRLSCNQPLTSESNTQQQAISYYAIQLSDDSYHPITISTCSDEIDTVTYLFVLFANSELDLYYGIGEYYFMNSYINEGNCSDNDIRSDMLLLPEIDLSQLDDHLPWFIGVQGWYNEPMDFTIEMTCDTGSPTNDPTQPPTVEPTLEPTGRPSSNPTKSPTKSPTPKYSFPATKETFSKYLPYEVSPVITCGTAMDKQSVNKTHLVAYFGFSITSKTYPPITISTCPVNKTEPDHAHLDAHIYILKEFDDGEVIILQQSATAFCDGTSAEIDVSHLQNGDYFAVIQGDQNKNGVFSITMSCDEPPPKVPRDVVMAAVFGTCGFMILAFIIYYIYEWNMYCKVKRSNGYILQKLETLLQPQRKQQDHFQSLEHRDHQMLMLN